MSLELLVPLILTSLVTIVGWFIAHDQSKARDNANKRRDLRIQYLIEAYRRLENASNREDMSRAGDIESAIADICLLGSLRQIELAQKFSKEFAETRSGSLDELITDLRNELREKLDLASIPGNVSFLRIIPKS